MICDDDGNIPLHYAALGGKSEVATLLITKYGSPVNHLNNKKETPLHLACTKGHITFIQTLVTKHKADINICDMNKHTPLKRAALSGQAEVIDCFIREFNCNADIRGTNGCRLLHLTCQKGHLELIKQLVTGYNLDPMISDDDGNTPLHYAALGGKSEVATLLITMYGSPVNHLNNNNETPLQLACTGGNSEIIRVLAINHGANLHSCDSNGDTPLHKAAIHGRAVVVNCLINEFGCNPNAKGYEGRTILHHACYQGHIELVETLLTHYKLDLLSVDNKGYTPLHLAAIGHRKTIAQVLITKYGHSVKGTDGCGLLHLVCQQGDFEMVEQLVTDYKFDPNIGDDSGNTPLHYAALGGKNIVATLLITKCGSPVNQLNNNNETSLHLACTEGHLTFIQTLVTEHKADINIHDINSHIPLQRAALSGQAEVVAYFIEEFNCNAYIKGMNGCSLLHLACQQRHLKLIEQLVTDYKLDPMVGDDSGNTPLHYAALGGKSEVATLLITKYGSPVDQLNNNNETPLHLACTKGHLTLIQILVAGHKADINTHDINNDTPLQRAALGGQTKVVCLLTFEFSCDLNVTGDKGRNLLHYACVNGHDELAWTLINTFNFSLISADVDGNTPLHVSAMFGQYECVRMLLYIYRAPVYLRNNSGKSALEVAEDGVTRNMIETYLKEEHDRIQYDYKEVQILSSKKYSGAQRLTRVFVLGNVQSGKSTLIESLKSEGFFSIWVWNQVSEATVPPHTSGIIPSTYESKAIGRVLYYDFAGDPEYYSSHSAIMSSVIQSEGGTNIYLILINFQKDNKCILEELGYWFNFISYHSVKLREKCKALVIGSHVDLITTSEVEEKVNVVSQFPQMYLSHTPKASFEVVEEYLALNCCKPRSARNVYTALQQIVRRAATFRLSEEAAILLGLLEKDFENVIMCKVQTLMTHILETGIYLPNIIDSLYPKIMELHTVGLLMVIKSRSDKLEDDFLLLNVSKLTNEVHKLLFSKDSAKQFLLHTDLCSASMGILPAETYLNSILPEYITIECLIQLQYCQEFSHAEVKFDYSVVPTEDSSTPTLLYFPGLCEIERKKNIGIPENYNHSISWYVRCCGKFDYLPPRFLHVLLLRLAHSFALPIAHDPSIKNDITAAVWLYNRRCTMWKNGIHWLMEEGVECYVEMVNNSKGIVVISKSEEAHQSICTEMLFKIIREIHQAKEEFCGTVTLQEYLMNSDDPTAFTDEDKLFSTRDIIRVLQEEKPYIVSASGYGHTQLKATKIAHLKNYIHWDAETNKGTLAPKNTLPAEERICTKLCERNHSILYAKLIEHSAKWREIGTHLGFCPSELDEIQARPPLYATAPKSLLSAMLAEWLQWSPGDQRGSTKCATLEGLSDALNKAGLSEAAQLILTLDLTT